MAVRTLGRRRVLQVSCGVALVALLHQLPFGFLLPTPLFLPQQLLGLQEDPGVDAADPRVAVPGALVAGVPGILLSCLEALAGWVRLVPGLLGDGAGVLPRLPGTEKETNEII